MTQETTISKEDQLTLYSLDCVSQICYHSKISIEYLTMALKFLPQSPLKDTVLIYRENQTNWLNKVLKSLRQYGMMAGIDIHKGMIEDLENMPMVVMFDIISNLKKTMDMEGVAMVVEELSELKDITPVLTNIVAIIRNEKNKQL